MSDRDNVAKKWGDFAEKRKKLEFQRMFALDHPVVQEYVYNTYLDGHSPFVYVRKFLPEIPCKSGLEIACGSGDLSIAVVNTGLCEQVDAFDISERAIQVARHSATVKGIYTISFEIADANTISLPKRKYDFVYMSQSLHHIENIEHLYVQIHESLADGGIFFVSDYVGPTRMQWTDKQMEIMNSILPLLPDKYRCSLLNKEVRKAVKRISISDFMKIDPSEGVRSGEILPLAKEQFDIVEIRPMGCSIIYQLLFEIIHNFDENSEYDSALLRLICLMESLLIREGVIESDFACFVAKKRR